MTTTAPISHDELADLTLADMLPRFGAKWGCSNLRKKYEPTLPDVILWMPSLRCITFEIKVSVEDYRRDANKKGARIGDEHWYVCPAGVIDSPFSGCGLIWHDGERFTVKYSPMDTALEEPIMWGRASYGETVAAQMRLMLHVLATNETRERMPRWERERAGWMQPLIERVEREGRVKFRTAARTIKRSVNVLESFLRDHPTLCIVEEQSIRYVEERTQ